MQVARAVLRGPRRSNAPGLPDLVGRYANGAGSGSPWVSPSGWGCTTSPTPSSARRSPYGVYDLGANAGWVSVGTDHDTAAFAVATLRRWWQQAGRVLYPNADRLLVTADAGGSNGYRVRAWKTELARFAVETGLQVMLGRAGIHNCAGVVGARHDHVGQTAAGWPEALA
jgi:hypothetical protein